MTHSVDTSAPTVEKQGIFWQASYQSLDKIVTQATGQFPTDSLRKLYDNMLYFQLDVAAPTKGGVKRQLERLSPQQPFSEWLKYYQFEMPADLRLVCGQDTLRCAMHHLEQTGILAQRLRFLLGFEHKQQKVLQVPMQLLYTPTAKDTFRFYFTEPFLQS